MKKFIAPIVIILLIGIIIYLWSQRSRDTVIVPTQTTIETPTDTVSTSTVTETPEEVDESKTVIGTSVEERDITAYHYGGGEREVLFMGGIHGGYGWNTTLVAYELMDYLEANPSAIPSNVRVTVIPVLNPDGLNKVVGTDGRFSADDAPVLTKDTIPGRFNAHGVDLNRNFDCDWQASGKWQNMTVSGGSQAFSEPESQAVKKYVEDHEISGAIVWYSAAGGVYASACDEGVLPESKTLTNIYAKASGYSAHESFDSYAVTGDMVNWLAKRDVPAISVLLTNHTDTEWSKNKAGIEAALKHFAE